MYIPLTHGLHDDSTRGNLLPAARVTSSATHHHA